MSSDTLAPEVVEPLLTGRFGRPYLRGALRVDAGPAGPLRARGSRGRGRGADRRTRAARALLGGAARQLHPLLGPAAAAARAGPRPALARRRARGRGGGGGGTRVLALVPDQVAERRHGQPPQGGRRTGRGPRRHRGAGDRHQRQPDTGPAARGRASNRPARCAPATAASTIGRGYWPTCWRGSSGSMRHGWRVGSTRSTATWAPVTSCAAAASRSTAWRASPRASTGRAACSWPAALSIPAR